MKQKYFLTFLVSFGFILTFGQNNAINLTGSNGFYFSGPNGTTNYELNATNFTVEYDFYLNAPANQNARFSFLWLRRALKHLREPIGQPHLLMAL